MVCLLLSTAGPHQHCDSFARRTPCRTCQSWSTGAHILTDAAWSADEKLVLLALSGSLQVAVLHFVSDAPSLLANLMPLDLPGSGEAERISSLAYHSVAQRLAVGYAGADESHWVAVFEVQTSPVFKARHLGRVLPPAAEHRAPRHSTASGAAPMRVGFWRSAVPPDERVRSAAQPPAVAAASQLAVTWDNGAVTLTKLV